MCRSLMSAHAPTDIEESDRNVAWRPEKLEEYAESRRIGYKSHSDIMSYGLTNNRVVERYEMDR